jgi:hypothetical protein
MALHASADARIDMRRRRSGSVGIGRAAIDKPTALNLHACAGGMLASMASAASSFHHWRGKSAPRDRRRACWRGVASAYYLRVRGRLIRLHRLAITPARARAALIAGIGR